MLFTPPRRSRQLPRYKNRIGRDLAVHHSRQHSEPVFPAAAGNSPGIRKRGCVTSASIRNSYARKNPFRPAAVSATAAPPYEIPLRDHPRINRAQHSRIRNQRPERLHQIQRKPRPPMPQLMVKPEIWIESNRIARYRQVLRQHAVSQRQQSVYRIARRPPVPPFEVKGKSARSPL